jgi:hypothetical protein
VPSQEHPPVHFVRIDLRFSGSFIDMDAGDLTGVLEDASTMTFAFDDDELLDDLADALGELGLGADALTIVDVAGDGFYPPATLDVQATTTSGWPRFATGARFTRFLTLGAPAEESALRAVREAYSMATVRVQGPGVVAHDESPTVTVNAVTDPEAIVATTLAHTGPGEGLVGAIEGALGAD